MDDKHWHLKGCGLFDQLPIDEIALLESRSRIQTFPRKGLVYLPSDRSDAVLLVISGRIRLYSVTPDGKESVLTLIDPGELFGELVLFGQTRREEFAEAMESSVVVMIPGEEIRRLMEVRPSLTIKLSRLMGLRRLWIERRLRSLLFRSNRDRLISLLLELAVKYGAPRSTGLWLSIRLSHQEMASMIGSTRESVTLLLGELQYERLLEVRRRQIFLTDLKRLAASLDDIPPEVQQLVTAQSGA
jgi:CRP-like cAMP-binding protein